MDRAVEIAESRLCAEEEEEFVDEDNEAKEALISSGDDEKGDYCRLSGNENNENSSSSIVADDEHADSVVPKLSFLSNSSRPYLVRLRNMLREKILPNCFCKALCDGLEAFRLLKFASVTIVAVLILHPFVRAVGWENDENYTIGDFFLYDLHSVLLDVVSFFLVGRLYQHNRDFDRLLPYLIPTAIGMLFPSVSNGLRFLKHSLSMYEIMCDWTPPTFVFYIALVLVISYIVALHVTYAIRSKTVLRRIFELLLTVCLFVLPSARNSNFHMHHWYVSWMLGMHANAPTVWSASAQAFAWGAYINGVAVYGRDPVLTCAYSYYVSTDIRCDYMSCYTHKNETTGEETYNDMVKPDWRNCSAAGNYVP